MKKTFLFAAFAAVLAFTACNQKEDIESSASLQKATITVNLSGAMTKATGVTSNSTESEAKVNNFQVFVFRADGNLDGYAKSSTAGALSVDVTCTPGTREIYAVVNAADMNDVTTKSALLAKQSALVDNTLTSFVMVGSKDNVTVPAQAPITVPVDRIAARIVVKSITNGFEAQPFQIEAVYVTNVAGDALLSLAKQPSYTVSSWYGKEGIYTPSSPNNFTNPKAFVCDEPAGATVAAGASYSTAHYFYVYPNNYGIVNGGDWSARATKIVVKLKIGDTSYYYPINLTDTLGAQIIVENNKSYEVALTIGHYGNKPDDPDPEDKPVETSEGGVTIEVNPWDVVDINGGSITI